MPARTLARRTSLELEINVMRFAKTTELWVSLVLIYIHLTKIELWAMTLGLKSSAHDNIHGLAHLPIQNVPSTKRQSASMATDVSTHGPDE